MTPRCPFCNASGINNVQAEPLGPVLVIFCGQCGAIHGVLPNTKNKATAEPPPKQQPARPQPPPAPPLDKNLTPDQLAAMSPYLNKGSTMYRVIRHDNEDKPK